VKPEEAERTKNWRRRKIQETHKEAWTSQWEWVWELSHGWHM